MLISPIDLAKKIIEGNRGPEARAALNQWTIALSAVLGQVAKIGQFVDISERLRNEYLIAKGRELIGAILSSSKLDDDTVSNFMQLLEITIHLAATYDGIKIKDLLTKTGDIQLHSVPKRKLSMW